MTAQNAKWPPGRQQVPKARSFRARTLYTCRMQENYAETPVAEQLQDLILNNEDVDDFLEDLAVHSSNILGGASRSTAA